MNTFGVYTLSFYFSALIWAVCIMYDQSEYGYTQNIEVCANF